MAIILDADVIIRAEKETFDLRRCVTAPNHLTNPPLPVYTLSMSQNLNLLLALALLISVAVGF
ncbi:MAG TPA: hypothetical protein VNZ25_10370 [Candidatus Angelobacter sp.]|jgi:hypothetical protein|nr:hypothetical protein [Candidatus Angelobacter sp.]HXD90765.1 hypothetical protein [Candidatus Binataceae bacterium]